MKAQSRKKRPYSSNGISEMVLVQCKCSLNCSLLEYAWARGVRDSRGVRAREIRM